MKFFSLKNAFRDNILTKAMISLGNSIELPALVKRLGWRLLAASFPNLVKFSSRLRQLHIFAGYVRAMTKHHGATYTVNYLKASQLAVQKFVAGDRIKSLRDLNPDLPLPRLTTAGLPRFIPKYDRSLIRSGSPSVIRWWLTLFSIYRIISIPGKLKISTITDPFSGDLEFLNKGSLEITSMMRNLTILPKVPRFREAELLQIEKSSPIYRTS
jgi:hypothetical protein